MRSVVCFGEALIDFLNTGEQAQGPLKIKSFQQYPGGAPANAAVAVAKLTGKALFAGQVGDDQFGHFLEQALMEYGVNTQFLLKHPSASTALAFVILDQQGERSFSFVRQQTADVLFRTEQINQDWFQPGSIFHICSNTLTDPAIAETTRNAVNMAKQTGAIVSFDVNLRHNLWPQNQADRVLVNDLLTQAEIIKFSKEELEYLAGEDQSAYIQALMVGNCKLAVITDGANTMHYHTKTHDGSISPPKVKAVDTTAGGDAFIGALLFALSHCPDLSANLTQAELLDAMLKFASFCGGLAVTRPGAFPALPELAEVEQQWRTTFALIESQK